MPATLTTTRWIVRFLNDNKRETFLEQELVREATETSTRMAANIHSSLEYLRERAFINVNVAGEIQYRRYVAREIRFHHDLVRSFNQDFEIYFGTTRSAAKREKKSKSPAVSPVKAKKRASPARKSKKKSRSSSSKSPVVSPVKAKKRARSSSPARKSKKRSNSSSSRTRAKVVPKKRVSSKTSKTIKKSKKLSKNTKKKSRVRVSAKKSSSRKKSSSKKRSGKKRLSSKKLLSSKKKSAPKKKSKTTSKGSRKKLPKKK